MYIGIFIHVQSLLHQEGLQIEYFFLQNLNCLIQTKMQRHTGYGKAIWYVYRQM